MEFKDLGIDESLVKGLEKQGILNPTYIQQKVIPVMSQGKDVIAQSETGSGKTLAYLLPIFMKADETIKGTQAIVLTPTHELAVQVNNQFKILAENSGSSLSSALVIGGANMERQIDKLKTKPPVVIGSAGRILDLIKKRKIQAHLVKTIVIDEADRMLDDANIESVKSVIKTTLKDRQTVLLSASMGKDTIKKASEFMKEPVLIEKESGLIPKNIKHFYITADKRDGIVVLRKILAGEKPKKVIVFINKQDSIEVLCEKLKFHDIKAEGIYGAAHKNDRKKAMDDFRDGKINVLVASDIGARGLDFDSVEYVINLDMPEEAVYYQHRAGRTGRNGENGIVVSVVAPYERKLISKYERELGIKFEAKTMSHGKISDIDEKTKVAMEKKAAESKKRYAKKQLEKSRQAEKRNISKYKKVYNEKNKK